MTKVFDCNCGFGRSARPPLRFAAEAAELIEEMDFCGIDEALPYHANMRFASPVVWNAVLSEQVGPHRRLHATWAILPESTGELPPPEAFLDAMRAGGVRALRAFPQEHHYRLNRRTFPELLPALAERRIPLLVKENLSVLPELLDDCPALTVIAVNQGPHSLERYLRPLMDSYSNLHVETSGLLVDGVIEGLCDRYGPGRLLFGSGFPDNCGGGALLRLAHADIAADAKTAIAAGNIERLLKEARP